MKIVEGREQDYKDWYDLNDDPYGRACFRYAEHWADMLEELITDDTNAEGIIIQNAQATSHEADTEGITGFMYGCAVSILVQAWKYGEYLGKWHNSQYDYDGDGVVNPAALKIR